MQDLFKPVVHIVLLSCAVISLAGCGTGEEKYIPTETTAREAVNAALTAWKSDQLRIWKNWTCKIPLIK